jgi:Uma2 family endonuclease
MMDGNPIYYNGYKSVLNKTKTIDDIIGSSGLQSYILMYLQMILFKKLDMEKFIILSNELGLHIGPGNNLAGDLLIYKKQQLTADKIKNNYADIAPEVAIEIDTKADLNNLIFQKYVSDKTKKLLNFGIKKVIWIFTYSQQINIAEQDKDWIVINWNKDVE